MNFEGLSKRDCLKMLNDRSRILYADIYRSKLCRLSMVGMGFDFVFSVYYYSDGRLNERYQRFVDIANYKVCVDLFNELQVLVSIQKRGWKTPVDFIVTDHYNEYRSRIGLEPLNRYEIGTLHSFTEYEIMKRLPAKYKR